LIDVINEIAEALSPVQICTISTPHEHPFLFRASIRTKVHAISIKDFYCFEYCITYIPFIRAYDRTVLRSRAADSNANTKSHNSIAGISNSCHIMKNGN
jgi:cellobiose-specific phosphotransferase system component IIC